MGRLIVNPDYIPELPDYIRTQAGALKESGRLERIPDPAKILLTEFLVKAHA